MNTRIFITLLIIFMCTTFSGKQVFAAETVEHVTLQLKWLHQFQFAGYYAAKEKGFFAQEGLNVTIRERGRDKEFVQSVLDGDAQYGVADAGLLLDRLQGKPVVLLKQIFQHSPLVFVTRQDSGLKTPYDLRGKRVMIDRTGYSFAPLVAMLLNTLGDLSQIDFVDPSFNLDSLTNGHVDAYSAYLTNQPYSLRKQDIPINIIDPRSYGIDFYGDNLFTTDSELREHPLRVDKMIRATLKGWQYALANPLEISTLIKQKYAPDASLEKLMFEAHEVMRMIAPEEVPLGSIIPARYEAIARTYERAGLTTDVSNWSNLLYQVESQHTVQGIDPFLGLTHDEIAWLKEHPKLRIGVDADYAPYSFRDDQGHYRGIVMEFCNYLGEKLGLEMEVVPNLSWPQIVIGVKEQNLDMVTTMAHRPERESFVNFTEIYLPTPLVIMHRIGDLRIQAEDDLDHSRVAMVEGYSSSKRIMMEHPTVRPLMVTTPREGLFAVATGKADAYVGILGNTLYLAKENGITNLEITSLYGAGTNGQRFGIRKDWPELASILDKTLEAMPETKKQKMFEHWLPKQTTSFPKSIQLTSPKPVSPPPTPISLTPAEKSWLKSHPKIEIGVMNAWPPFDFVDQHGQPRGIGINFIQALNKRLNNALIAYPGPWTKIYEKVKEKKLAALLDITPKESRKPHFHFTRPYLSVPHVIVAHKNSPFLRNEEDLIGKTIALEKGFGNVHYFKKNYPTVKIQEYPNTSMALDAVSRGEAEAYAGNRAVAMYMIEQEVILNLKIHGRLKKDGSVLAIGVRKDWPFLRDILQKALDDILPDEQRNIVNYWVTPEENVSPKRIDLTAMEKAWINSNPVIRVHNEMNWPPFNFNKGGQPMGFSIDYINLVAEKLGFSVEYVNAPSWDQFLKMMQQDKLDVMLNIIDTDDRRKYLSFTKPYMRSEAAILVRGKESKIKNLEDLNGRTVAVPKGSATQELLKRYYPNIELLPLMDITECIKAVVDKRADATYGAEYVLNYLTTESFIRNTKLVGKVRRDERFSVFMNIATAKAQTMLRDLLQKGMNAVTPGERRELNQRWLTLDSVAESKRIQLTTEEDNWLEQHPKVRLGVDPAWPPFDFVNQSGEHDGLIADVLTRLEEKLGIEFELVPNLTWSEVKAKAQKQELDVISLASQNPERKKYLKWSNPFVTMPLVIASKDDFKQVDSVKELKGHRIAVAKGYAVGSLLKDNHPELAFIEALTPLDGLKMVSLGKADVYIGYLGTISYLILENGLFNIKIAGPTEFPSRKLSIAVRSDWPELLSLINKGLASISQEEMTLIRNKWVPSKKWMPLLETKSTTPEKDNRVVWWLLIGIVFIFSILLIGALFLPRLFTDEVVTRHFGSVRFRNMALASLSLMSVIVGLLVWYTLDQNKKATLNSISTELKAVLQNSMERNDFWILERLNQLDQLGQNPELITITQRLLEVQPKADPLKNSRPLAEAREFFSKRKKDFGGMGFFIIGPENINLSSPQDSNLGMKSLIAKTKPDLLAQAFKGKTVFIPPIQSDVTIKVGNATSDDSKEKPLTLFFIGPIKNFDGEVIAVLAAPQLPTEQMSYNMHSGRIGKSGETYMIDSEGRQVTESRFRSQLYDIGLLDIPATLSATIEVRNPGVNLLEGLKSPLPRNEQPFTQMTKDLLHKARELKAAETPRKQNKIMVDVKGYRGYRGVPVFGAWIWEPHLGLGMTTEINVDEVLSGYYTLRQNLFSLAGTMLLLSIATTLLTLMLGERATRVMRRTQRELKERVAERTERLRIIIDTAVDGIIVFNHEGVIQDFSPAAENMFGYNAKEVIGCNIDILVPEPVKKNLKLYLERYLKSGEKKIIGRSMEEMGRRKNGTLFPFEYTVAEGHIGQEYFFTGIVRDITERKKAENELKKLSRAVEQSPASVLITDINGKIEYVNPRFCQVTGYSAAEVLGQNPRILKSGQTAPNDYQKLWETITAGKEWRGELLNKKKNNELYWDSASISPIMSSGGTITHYLSVNEDITERKKIMEDLETAKLTAENATRAKSDFLANMSHEIRTPMNAIIGLSHLALKTELTSKQSDYICKIDDSAKSLLGIINDILDFSKIEAGKLDIENVDFDLDDVLQNLSNMISGKIQEKNLELVFDLHSDVPTLLKGDSLRLGQILLNLGNNAVKFTEQGEIVISVVPLEIDKNHAALKFSVRDTGIGLSQEQQEKLFKSFQQVDTSITRKYGGTGLGLTISKNLAEMMGGEIGVDSEAGKGSTFYFTAKFGRQEKHNKNINETPDALLGIKVLVVDDNQTFRTVIRGYLEDFGFYVEELSSGNKTLQVFDDILQKKKQPFDLVLIDWHMPGMDGIETSKRIQELSSGIHLPKIIMATGFGREDVIKQAEEINLDGFLLKPITQSMLFDTIMVVFGQEGLYSFRNQASESPIPEGFDAIRGAQILLVEDNEINQQVAQELLEGEGFFVSIASNGQIALEKLEEAIKDQIFDVVLMDLQMPIMDGYTATRRIRKDERFKNVPVIAMTADAMAGVKEKVLQAGMDDYVAKPIDQNQLFQALTSWIIPGKRPLNTPPHDTTSKHSKKSIKLPFSELPGIDIDLGLSRANGNTELYFSVLCKFFEMNQEVTKHIRNALAQSDQKTAQRLAHTVKGVSGNIGAIQLQNLSGDLEKSINNGSTSENILQEFESQITQILASIKPHWENKNEKNEKRDHEKPAGDVDILQQELLKLKPLLKQGMPKPCLQVTKELISHSWPRDIEMLITTLGKKVRTYRFDEAEKILEDLEHILQK